MSPASGSVVRFSVVRWALHSLPGLSARGSAMGKPAFWPDAGVWGRAGRQKGMGWVFAPRSWIDPSSWGGTFPIGAGEMRRPRTIISDGGRKDNSHRGTYRPLQTHKTIFDFFSPRRRRGAEGARGRPQAGERMRDDKTGGCLECWGDW